MKKFFISDEDIARATKPMTDAIRSIMEQEEMVSRFSADLIPLTDKQAVTWLFVNQGIQISVEVYQRIKSKWKVKNGRIGN